MRHELRHFIDNLHIFVAKWTERAHIWYHPIFWVISAPLLHQDHAIGKCLDQRRFAERAWTSSNLRLEVDENLLLRLDGVFRSVIIRLGDRRRFALKLIFRGEICYWRRCVDVWRSWRLIRLGSKRGHLKVFFYECCWVKCDFTGEVAHGHHCRRNGGLLWL